MCRIHGEYQLAPEPQVNEVQRELLCVQHYIERQVQIRQESLNL
jgi:hypothetical protein